MSTAITNTKSGSGDGSGAITATPIAAGSKGSAAFSTPSFVSPEPAAGASKAQMQRTLSAGLKKKQKRKLDGELQRAAAAFEPPTSGLARKKHKLTSSGEVASARLTPQLQQLKLKMKLAAAVRAGSSSAGGTTEKKSKTPLQDISNNSSSSSRVAVESSNQRKSDVPTRKLDFTPTPVKAASATKKQRNPTEDVTDTRDAGATADASSESSSDSDSSDSSSDSGYSSDEAEVAFDAVTLGNTRVVREGESPFSAASAMSTSSSSRATGVEYRFSVSSTVSSIAVAPNGQFLVVGFYNGTIYLYPLSKDSFRFRGGVLLDHITARGMYTQLMVRVALPEDGKFIFAGVYRGSTEIRAFEVDSIRFPSSSDLARKNKKNTSDDGEDDDDDDDDEGDFGVPHAQAVAHTYSDPKLKGFGAVKSIFRSKTNSNEYHLLCGLGIKNLHLWRFFQLPTTKEWTWECIFDKQANGISLEYLSFHPSEADQIISKSEHQNIRVWTLEEELHDDDFTSVTLTKKSHVDVKNTVDTTAVYGDYAYGGSESLALIDLRSASRMELDLPLSTKEQKAQLEAAAASQKNSARITASMRQRNSRRRGAATGAEELGGMRHMRTVSQVAGRESSPFTIGMCSDGSVFLHKPQSVLGMATPLEYVEGYERFFQDPSLSFQAQFSDLTRVNTSGLLSVLPLPPTEKEDWMVVAANQDQLLVRSLKAFLCRNQQATAEHSKAKRDMMRRLGAAASSESSSSSDSDNDSSSSSDSEGELAIVLNGNKPVIKPVTKPSKQEQTSTLSSALVSKAKERKEDKSKQQPAAASDDKKRAKLDASIKKTGKSATTAGDEKVAANSASAANDRKKAASSLEILSEQAVQSTPLVSVPLVVTTPKRSTTNASSSSSNPMTPYHSVASPVVSVTSLSSGGSNPNTPEAHAKLSQRAKQLLVLKDLEWTPPPKSAASSKEPRDDMAAVAVITKPSNSRSKTLFSDVIGDADKIANDNGAAAEAKAKSTTSSGSKTSKRSSVTSKSSKQVTSTKRLESGSEAAASRSKKALAAALRKERAALKKHSDATKSLVAEKEATVEANDVEMAESGDDDEEEVDGDDDELEFLEEHEPEFVTTPLVGDGGSLLSASLFQFQLQEKTQSSTSTSAVECGSHVLNEQANLLMQFTEQNERLQRNFYMEKERIYQQHDCACSSALSMALKKKSGQAGDATCAGGGALGKGNWKKSLSSDFLRRKHLKRRQKKQIALKLRQLHGNYRAQIRELLAVQKLQANALTARQRFNHLYQQLRRQEEEEASRETPSLSLPSSSSSSSTETPSPAPIVEDATPQPLSISFPYLSLLASLSSSSS